MQERVRPWILSGGIGLVIGFVLGLATAHRLYAQHMEADLAARRADSVSAATAERGADSNAHAVHAVTASSSLLTSDAPAEAEDTVTHLVMTTGRPVRGSEGAPVTIVEFTDYECPYCQEHFAKTFPMLLAQYGDKMKYVVMNFPIAKLHPDAFGAAEAAECAEAQGRFWEYHDRLFVASALDRATLDGIATQVHLDGAAFARCVDTHASGDRVRGQMAQATSLGVNATPTFFINGRKYSGAMPIESFRTIIDDALKHSAH